MNKQKIILYSIGLIFSAFGATAFISPELLFGEIVPFDFGPLVLSFLSLTLGLIFLGLALVQNSDNSTGVLYKPVNAIIILVLGFIIFLITYFSGFLGLEFFGVKNIFYLASIIFLSAGFYNLFNKS